MSSAVFYSSKTVSMEQHVRLKTQLKAHTENCFVVLKRLDEKLLNQYLQRDLKTGVSVQTAKDRRTLNKEFRKIRSNSKCSSIWSVRKRKRIKPLCYTDDEDDSAVSTPLKNTPGNDHVGSGERVDPRATENLKSHLTTEGKEEQSAMESSRGDPCCGPAAASNGTEIMNESPSSFQGSVNCIEMKAVCDNFVTNVEFVENLEDREEGEDDRSTVVFDKVADLEEVREEKENRKKLKKKKIINRKRQRLIKFKRKSMTGTKLGKVRKSKGKIAEGGLGQDAAEKNSSDGVAEDCLKKVCSSVRRLHDMSAIILQLQKEMPKDAELGLHFKRVINAQQENFHREIRKSRKMIIKCFEKMMKVYKVLNKVASEVSKRTFLTADEVIYVLSLCILSDGSCDMAKTEQVKSSANNPCKGRVARKESPAVTDKTKAATREVVAEMPNPAPPSTLPSPTVGFHQPAPQTSAPVVTETGEAWLPPRSNHQVQPSKPRIHSWDRQHSGNTQTNDPRMRQSAEMNSFRQLNLNPPVAIQPVPMTQTPSTRPRYCNVPYPSQNWFFPPRPGPPSGYTPYATIGHYQQVRNIPPRPAGAPGLRLHPPTQSCVVDKPTPYQMSITNRVDCPVLSTHSYRPVPNRTLEINERLNDAPAVNHRGGALEPLRYGSTAANGHVLPSSQTRLAFLGSAGHSQAAGEKSVRHRLPVLEACDQGVETEPKSRQVPQVLDPTIPQKLTMKNCRLQAGPVLESEVKQWEERKKCRSENVDQETSKTRVYICAQSGCKKPGVRICKFCQSVIYCSETCQLKHWELKHNVECCQLKELRG